MNKKTKKKNPPVGKNSSYVISFLRKKIVVYWKIDI